MHPAECRGRLCVERLSTCTESACDLTRTRRGRASRFGSAPEHKPPNRSRRAEPGPSDDLVQAFVLRTGRALYEAFEVKRYFTAVFTFLIPVSLFDSESRFFAPTRTFRRPARAGAIKAGRRSALTSRSIVSRPSLDRPEHGGTLVVSG